MRDNAARFKKEPDIMNLILVRQREDQQQVEVRVSKNQSVQEPIDFIREALEQDASVNEQPEDEHVLEVLTEEDRKLETLFITELENLTHSTMPHLEPRVKLPKCKLHNHICESGNKVLELYLREADTIPEISDKVYAMGKAIASKLELIVDKDQPGKKKENTKGRNRRERKLKLGIQG